MKRSKIVISVVMTVAALGIIAVSAMNKSNSGASFEENKNDKVAVVAEYTSDYDKILGEFTAETTSKLLADVEKNSCYSPTSLFAALTLTAECAAGETRAELIESLGVESIEQLESVYNQMVDDITEDGEDYYSYVTLANSLWIRNEYLMEESKEVMERCKKAVSSDIFACETIDAGEVNDWVCEKTNGVIDELLSESKICDMALINTLHYKSKWTTLFSEDGEKDFWLEDGNRIKAEYISAEITDISYMKYKDVVIAGIPLHEGEMIFVLPGEGSKLETILSKEMLDDLMSIIISGEMDKSEGEVCFPTFECSDGYDKEFEILLKSMGVTKLFERNQWEISDELNDSLVEIMQNTKLVVDSYGVEAAAATAGVYTLGMGPMVSPKVNIIVDRPFLYILMKDDVPLFVGTVYNPAE